MKRFICDRRDRRRESEEAGRGCGTAICVALHVLTKSCDIGSVDFGGRVGDVVGVQ